MASERFARGPDGVTISNGPREHRTLVPSSMGKGEHSSIIGYRIVLVISLQEFKNIVETFNQYLIKAESLNIQMVA